MSDDLYAGYGQWKDWSESAFMRVSRKESNYFSDELRGLSLAGKNVLEIGFGNGSFLRWASDCGATLFGTEVLDVAKRRAEAEGVTVLPLDLAESLPALSGRFALIAAFDVMEHLTRDQNAQLLDQIEQLLEPGGCFIARFPNGQSPFGRVYQHGDQTHVSVLSAGIARQMLIGRSFQIVRLGNPVPMRSHGFLKAAAGKVRAMMQRMVESGIARLYGFSVPLGPNTLMLVRKNA